MAGELCGLGVVGDTASFLLWGDSHGLALAPAIGQLAVESGRAGLLAASPACPPLLGVERRDQEGAQPCPPVNAAVAELIRRRPNLRTVVLVGRWALNAEGTRYGNERGPPALLSPEGIRENPRLFAEGLERTIRFLNEQGREVIVVAQVPEIGWSVPSVLARSRLFGRPVPPSPTLKAFQHRQQAVDADLRDLAAHYRFRVIDASKAYCGGAACVVTDEGRPLYRDEHHLSVRGSSLAVGWLRGIF